MKYLIAIALLFAATIGAQSQTDNICTMEIDNAGARIHAESFASLFADQQKFGPCVAGVQPENSPKDEIIWIRHLAIAALVQKEMAERLEAFISDKGLVGEVMAYDAKVKR